MKKVITHPKPFLSSEERAFWKERRPSRGFAIKESARSEEVRAELRKQGYTIRWTVIEDLARISYWNNDNVPSRGLLLQETAHDLEWGSWDIFVRLTADNNIAKTYAALDNWTREEVPR